MLGGVCLWPISAYKVKLILSVDEPNEYGWTGTTINSEGILVPSPTFIIKDQISYIYLSSTNGYGNQFGSHLDFLEEDDTSISFQNDDPNFPLYIFTNKEARNYWGYTFTASTTEIILEDDGTISISNQKTFTAYIAKGEDLFSGVTGHYSIDSKNKLITLNFKFKY